MDLLLASSFFQSLIAVWYHTYICSLLSSPLLPPSYSSSSFTDGQWRKKKKNQCLFCKIATNDYLQSSERVKNVRPHTHKLFNDFAKKMCPCIGPHLFYGLAWQSCYIFKEKLLEYNMQSKKRKREKCLNLPSFFPMCLGTWDSGLWFLLWNIWKPPRRYIC